MENRKQIGWRWVTRGNPNIRIFTCNGPTDDARECMNHNYGKDWSVEYVYTDVLPETKQGTQVNTVSAMKLNPIIAWLEGGCDPKAAAQELRLLVQKIPQG